MQRKYKPIDPKEFANADDINRPSIKGEMRKVYSEIHLKITERGWAAKDVVAWFNNHGIPMTEQLFRVYLFDLDRENDFVRRPKKEVSNFQPKTKATSALSTTTKTEQVDIPVVNSLVQTAQNFSKETRAEQNPFHALTGEVKAGEFNPVPSAKPEFDN
ncbi:MAG: hypothetical protein PSV17_03270 [Methylotenera sp.]|uniref:hypothetical protein n=1 Tax=Methylotenera sp. TaxID=2051956 RepID=UPI00248961D5|nr:hypothetical protein [Methylotenera sp.]MDI1308437.1 hypothetical protein [Methylotenera sp.]